VETVTERNGNNSLRSLTTSTTSSDGRNVSVTRDVNGDSNNDQTESIVIDNSGNRIDTLSNFTTTVTFDELGHPTYTTTLKNRTITTTSANGLSQTVTLDKDGNNVIDETLTKVMVLNA